MDQSTVAIIGIATTAVVTVIGWSASHIFTSRRDLLSRQQESAISYIERQINELYGPLYSLIEQIFSIYRIQENLLRDEELTQRQKRQLVTFIYSNYFQHLHERMHEVLMTKLYLVEGNIPKSFLEYLEHSNQELVQRRLLAEFDIDTRCIAGPDWPPNLESDVKTVLDELRIRVRTMRGLIPPDVPDGTASRRSAASPNRKVAAEAQVG